MPCVCRLVAHVDTSAGHSTTERAPVPNPTTIMYDVIATMYDVIATLPTQCGSHACMVVLHAYARRHCMSTARVSAIPTPRSVTSAALPRSLQRDRDVVLPLRISNRTPRRNPPVV